jgi:hypothetical protein
MCLPVSARSGAVKVKRFLRAPITILDFPSRNIGHNGAVGRKKMTMNGNGGDHSKNGRRRPIRIAARESLRPLRLRGRKEFITAMVDALNDILAAERALA